MPKDPAFLFYSSDFIIGTSLLTDEEVGKYIRILCWIHQHGRIKKQTIENLVGKLSDNLSVKFRITDDGFLINDRLAEEIEKRKKFTESRVNNGKMGGRKPIGKPIGNPTAIPKKNLPENGNINENEIKDIIEFVNITAQWNLNEAQIKTYWKAFLIHSNGESYNKKSDRIKHFRDWLKKQKPSNGTAKGFIGEKPIPTIQPKGGFGKL